MKEPDQKDEPEEFPRRRRKIPPRAWESAVEKQIREAMERGEFDDLPGQGKPLDLRRDPNVPEEWELAFKLLKDAGFAPAWIEESREIRTARAELFEPFDSYLKSLRRSRPRRPAYEAQLCADFRKNAQELNRRIDVYNLQAPSPLVHHARIQIEQEIAKFKHAAG